LASLREDKFLDFDFLGEEAQDQARCIALQPKESLNWILKDYPFLPVWNFRGTRAVIDETIS